MSSKLNLPLWSSNSKSVNRVGAARAKAYKTAADIVSRIPNSSKKAEELHSVMNKMLSAGTIKSLEEFYQLTGIGNPTPTQYEKEASLNKSGFTIVNGSIFFKLTNTDNVEALRMLYMAGMSISDIRKKVSSMKEGDILCLSCGKQVRRFPKMTYQELMQRYKDVRAYPEYITVADDSTYAVLDTLVGKDSTYVMYIEQESNNKAFLSCSEVQFPVTGTLKMNIGGDDYSFDIDAVDETSLMAQLNLVGAPIDIQYDKGLSFTSNTSFYFYKTDILVDLNIRDSLRELRESIVLGYTGAELLEFVESPYNVVVKKPEYSRSNTRRIYRSLKDNQVPEDICNAYLLGESLYSKIEDRSTALRELIEKDPNNSALITAYKNDLYSSANVRIVGTTRQTINKLLKLSDEDFEYLMRFRLDVTGIDPYVSHDMARDTLIAKSVSSTSGSFYSKTFVESDAWKQNTANVRTVEIYLNISAEKSDPIDKKDWLDKTYEFLDGVMYEYHKERYSYNETFFTDETLGMDIATTMDVGASFSIARGLDSFANIRSSIDMSFMDTFNEDMLVIQAYLDAAFTAFSGICKKLGAIMSTINSSLGINASAGSSFGLDGGSILQCSLSVDLGLNIPIYIPLINELMLALIDMLEAVIQGLIDLENMILCPIQNLLDKYINTEKFALPCKISYDVPVISGLDSYLKGYLSALNGLKVMCRVNKRDGDWIKYKATNMPGSLSLVVTRSNDCKES